MKDELYNRSMIMSGVCDMDMDILLNILDNLQNAVLIINTEGTIVYINREYTARLGIPPEKLLGRKLSKIEPKAFALQVLETREPICDVVDYVESLKINAVGITQPLYNSKGEFFGVVSIFNNVTEFIKISQELERSREMSDYLMEQLRETHLPQSFREYIAENKALKKTLQLAAKVAQTDSTILILGESGVGKEVMAKAIHQSSKRSSDPLIKVNCASIPEELLESELFGYEEGAFTGAKKGGKMGKFELANGGTIFLDEIGDMSMKMQAKLLRVLQERELERVGGTKSIPLNIRVIAATNKVLEEMVEAGTFRLDLYYRLNVVSLTIPPLRERREDIIPLARFLLKRMSGSKVGLSASVIQILQSYDWPGNVRELENVLEYANIVRDLDTITIKDLPQYLKPELSAEDSKSVGRLNLRAATDLLEKDYIMEAIKACKGNKTLAIRELGISRRSFYEKIKKYGFSDID